MNKRTMLIVIAAIAGGVAGGEAPAAAQTDQGTAVAPDQTQGPGQIRRGLPGYRLRPAAEKLSLNAEQRKKMQAVSEDEMKQLKAMREDRSLTKEQKMAKYRQIREATHEKVKEFLTPEQRKKYEERLEKDRMFRENLRKVKTEKKEQESGK